jgi:hypothetical protein
MVNGPLYCGYGSANTDFWSESALDLLLSGGDARHTAGESRGRIVRWRLFVLGPIFKAQGWATSPFNIYPIKAATCGATWSGFAAR